MADPIGADLARVARPTPAGTGAGGAFAALRQARHGSRAAERGLSAILLLAGAALLAGVWVRASDATLGFDLPRVVEAVAGQLAVTVPAALLVSAAMVLNVAAGAVLVRALRRAPLPGIGDLVLAGFGGAVVLDLVLLLALGSVGLFRWPIVGAALLAVTAAGALVRPLTSHRPRPGRIRPARWLLVGLIWAGPVILALASPIVPFADVLPNHVAPAQHILVFGDFASLATDPSPIYGSSRLFLGETALIGTLATLTGLSAALALAAFAIPLLLLSGIAMARLASAAFGRTAGYWALLAFPLSFTFVRLNDARDSVTALVLAAFAFTLLVVPRRERMVLAPRPGQLDWLLAIVLTATILVHPLVGALAVATVVIVTLADPSRFAGRVGPALVATIIACLPQLGLMIGLEPPAWVGLAALAAAGAVGIATAGLVERIPQRPASVVPSVVPLPAILAGLAAVAVIAVALVSPGSLGTAAANLRLGFPLLFGAGALVALGRPSIRRGGRGVLIGGVLVGLAALTAAALVPATSLTGESIRYEIPKAIGYWLPWLCVPAAAGVIAALWRWQSPPAVRLGAVGAVLVVALLPLGAAVPNTQQATHPVADTLAYDLRTAESGYWIGYPDTRLLLDAPERQFVERIVALESSGELGAHDRLLNVAASLQAWKSIPIGVFTGAMETLVTTDATPTIFTTGNRLFPMARLGAELNAGFAWVVLEPAGLTPSVRSAIVAAGYRSVFENSAGELFRRG